MRPATFLRSTAYGAAAAIAATGALLALAAAPIDGAMRHRFCAAAMAAPSADVRGFGEVSFANSCKAEVQPALQREIARLHSFEAQARDFVAITKTDPGCAMAWWGAAMAARGNPLAGSLDDKSLTAGRRLADKAKAVAKVTPREKSLVAAMDAYYRPYPDQQARARAYAERMDAIRTANPDDPDIAALDGLAIIEGVDLNDGTHARQKRAGAILEAVMKAHPRHPGAPHYLIHAYDYTALAPMAVHAAEIYPTIATASSHAQHMPAHIWSMLGRWDRSIDANRKASFVADRSSAHGDVKGDIVFEHAFDFIAYARLQKGEDKHVAADIAGVAKPPLVISARYALERDDWTGATRLRVPSEDSFDAALAHFARGYGAARAGDAKTAARELKALKHLRAQVVADASEYWGVFVDIYADAIQAWMLKDEGRNEAALTLMRKAADRDDGHEKHIYLENKILPMRESLADMELALGQPKAALASYETALKLAPNRWRSFAGAAKAAKAAGDKAAAREWAARLVDLGKDGDQARPAYSAAKTLLATNG